jgi:hypothetical protein
MRQLLAGSLILGACVAWPSRAFPFEPPSGPTAAINSLDTTCSTNVEATRPMWMGRSDPGNAPWRPAAAVAPAPAIAQRVSVNPSGNPAVVSDAAIDVALNEMLRGRSGVLRWLKAPELVILMSVMEYQGGVRAQYAATPERIRQEDAHGLVADLNAALALLTDNTFTEFAAVHFESVPAGSKISVMRPGQIVVGRYKGVRDQLDTIGLGGRFGPGGGTISGGSIVLDSDYDVTSSIRHLLRAHELGHALGYNHVESRPSIMNPRIGPEPTDFDRRAARIAFRGEPPVATAAFCPEP